MAQNTNIPTGKGRKSFKIKCITPKPQHSFEIIQAKDFIPKRGAKMKLKHHPVNGYSTTNVVIWIHLDSNPPPPSYMQLIS